MDKIIIEGREKLQFSFWTEKKDFDALRTIAAKKNISITNLINQAIRQVVKYEMKN